MAIELNYAWNRDEFLRASYVNFKRRSRSKGSRLLTALVVFMLGASVFFIFRRGYQASDMIIAIVAVYWFLLRWPLYRFMLGQQFKKYAEQGSDVHWLIDEQGFRGGSKNSQGEFGWNGVTSIVKAKDGFLVYRYPVFHWLPLTSFRSVDDIVWFENIAKQKVKNYVVFR